MSALLPRTLAGLATVLALVAALALVPASASAVTKEQRSTAEEDRIRDDVSSRVMCPSCSTTLKNSDSPAADRMREYIDARIEDGWTADEIVNGLSVEYGGDGSILAAPETDTGRGMLAWGVPLLVALGALVIGALSVRRWRRASRPASR